jgi:hypothetical protein
MLARFSVQRMANEKKEHDKKIREMHQKSIVQRTVPLALDQNVCDYMLGLGEYILMKVLPSNKHC